MAAWWWWARVTSHGEAPCAVCGRTAAEGAIILGHHVIEQQVLRDKHLDRYLWDPRMGLPVCRYPCHEQHTSAFRRIPFRRLTSENLAVAEEAGLTHHLERVYPDEPR